MPLRLSRYTHTHFKIFRQRDNMSLPFNRRDCDESNSSSPVIRSNHINYNSIGMDGRKSRKNSSTTTAAATTTCKSDRLQNVLSTVSHVYHSINCPPDDQQSRLHYSTLTFDPIITNSLPVAPVHTHNHPGRLTRGRLSVVSSNCSIADITDFRLSRSCDHLIKEQIAPKVRNHKH